MLRNIHDPNAITSNELYKTIDELAWEFGNGMDYGYKDPCPVYDPKTGFFTVDLVCRQGACATTRFQWNHETKTSIYHGDYVGGKFVI
jgi:hypothetical protein